MSPYYLSKAYIANNMLKNTIIELILYFMGDSNVWKFEKIWFSGTFIIIRKPTDGHEDPYIPRLSSSGV
jgi:hypothetical protein